MGTLTTDRIAALLTPYLESPAPPTLCDKLSTYLDLLLRWNARTNLTAIRGPEQIVQRHFGESLFTAAKLAAILSTETTLLDFGSGAGFPGLPIQLYLPHLRVTLAESQGKKASFLREAVRTLNLSTEVWSARVETLPPNRLFHAVTLRAVDNMDAARAAALPRVAPGGYLVTLAGTEAKPSAAATVFPMPNAAQTLLLIEQSSPATAESPMFHVEHSEVSENPASNPRIPSS